MGAHVEVRDAHHAIITGPSRLRGSDLVMGDLRAGASLILGALAAEGRSTISGVHHVRRGYEDIERKLLELGAHIEPSSAEGPAEA
jgi:UDP-N-acetylglucosamine 1-carboxyvinyltransferase